MYNIISPIIGFIFIFSIMALLKLGFDFFRAIYSNPPKPFEMTKLSTLMFGLIISYIITFIIY